MKNEICAGANVTESQKKIIFVPIINVDFI